MANERFERNQVDALRRGDLVTAFGPRFDRLAIVRSAAAARRADDVWSIVSRLSSRPGVHSAWA